MIRMPERPAVLAVAGLSGGLLLAHALFDVSLWAWYACCAAAALVLGLLFIRARKAFLAVSLALVFAALGVPLYRIHAPALPEIPKGRYAIAGTVRDVRIAGDGALEYLLEDVKIQSKEGARVALEGKTRLHCETDVDPVMPGQILAVADATIRLPDGPRNPGGFNAKLYGFSKGYHYTAYAQETPRRSGNAWPLPSALLRIRWSAADAVGKLWPAPEDTAILRALLLGDSGQIEQEQQEIFSLLGISHVLAVSGLHVGFVALLLNGLLRGLLLCVPRRYSWRIGRLRWVRAAFVAAGLVLYAAVTGFSPSTLRALLMACALQIAGAAAVKPDKHSTLCAAVLVMLLLRPMDLFSSSFQLSVSAVAGIVLLNDTVQDGLLRIRTPRYLADSLAVSASAQIGILPLLARNFGHAPLLGLLANLFAVPLSGAAVMLGIPTLLLYAICPSVAAVPVFPVMLCTRLLSRLAEASAHIPLVSVETAAPPIALMALYWAGVLLSCPEAREIAGRTRKRWLAVCAAAAVVCVAGWTVSLFPPVPVLTMLDVGQGHATMIRHAAKAILIDTGDSGAPLDAARHYGLRYDAVFLTHGDLDHAGSLSELIDRGKVKALYVPRGIDAQEPTVREILAAVARKEIPLHVVEAGDAVQLGGLTVAIHAPVPGRWESGENAYMIVCSVSVDGRTQALFPGDLSMTAEQDILFPKARVLQVAHHGSKGSTSAEFLATVKPELALIPVGSNTYGHPSGELLARLDASGPRVERTDVSGAVEVIFGKDLRVKTWRRER